VFLFNPQVIVRIPWDYLHVLFTLLGSVVLTSYKFEHNNRTVESFLMSFYKRNYHFMNNSYENVQLLSNLFSKRVTSILNVHLFRFVISKGMELNLIDKYVCNYLAITHHRVAFGDFHGPLLSIIKNEYDHKT
jgi:hypothetical protein